MGPYRTMHYHALLMSKAGSQKPPSLRHYVHGLVQKSKKAKTKKKKRRKKSHPPMQWSHHCSKRVVTHTRSQPYHEEERNTHETNTHLCNPTVSAGRALRAARVGRGCARGTARRACVRARGDRGHIVRAVKGLADSWQRRTGVGQPGCGTRAASRTSPRRQGGGVHIR